MLTTRFSKFTNESIMLRIDFSEKSLESYFYKSQKWTFIKCPKSEKIFLSFKTDFYKSIQFIVLQ